MARGRLNCLYLGQGGKYCAFPLLITSGLTVKHVAAEWIQKAT